MNYIKILPKILFILIILVVGLFFTNHQVFAAPSIYPDTDLDGYAWSGNIGWISLNCKTGSVTGTSICPDVGGVMQSNYKVTIKGNGTIVGYAWSSNIGWIKFGGLGANGFPAGGGTSPVDANVNGSGSLYPNYQFFGWARACSGTIRIGDSLTSPTQIGDCSTMNSRPDGWDGWISLQGTGYGVSVSGPTGFNSPSYAWGDQVVGWIDMFTYAKWLYPYADLTATNCSIVLGASTCNSTLNWTFYYQKFTPSIWNASTTQIQYSNNVVSGVNVIKPVYYGDNPIEARDGSNVLKSLLLTIGCVPTAKVPSIFMAPDGKCEYQGPIITIISDKSILRSGDQAHINWTVAATPIPAGQITCKVSGPGINVRQPTSASGPTASESDSSALTAKSNFTISCDGPFGHEEKKVTVQVVPKSQEV